MDKVTNILNSLEGIERAKAPDKLFDKITEQLRKENHKPTYQWVAIAAAIAFIICSNIFVASTYSNDTSQSSESEYSELYNNFTLYE